MKKPVALSMVSFVLFLAILFSNALFPEYPWLLWSLTGLLFTALGALGVEYKSALRSRSMAYGINSAVTIVLVIGIVGVLNYVASRYPLRKDLTKNKLHTLSDQTVKVIGGLKEPVKANFFGKMDYKEQYRPLLERLKALSPKFEVEYVDPDRELARAKQAGINKYNTLQLVVTSGGRTRDQKIEEPTEEKVTNNLIKLLKDRPPTLCSIIGHGERSFASSEADGFDRIKKSLEDQSYEIKEMNLVQEGKIPTNCDAIVILGSKSAFFAPEVKLLEEFLSGGGRAIIALDTNLKGVEYAPELLPVLEHWYIRAPLGLIVDPISRAFGVDASAPIIANFNKEHAITRDFRTNNACSFPFTRPLEIITGAPAGINVQWLVQSTPNAWAAMNFKQIASGAVSKTAGDKPGPLTVGIAVEGKQKDSKATRNTRLVAFGSSIFATNNYGRFGGNSDLFLNAVSWVIEDESLISIRAKEDVGGKIELTQKSGSVIFLLTVIVIPLLIAAGGCVAWFIRRRL